MIRALSLCTLLPLIACGEADKSLDTGETGARDPARDGSYGGSMELNLSGGGGQGSCVVALELELLEGGEPAVSGASCCAVEGLSTHGDVDICVQISGAMDADEALGGDLAFYEQGAAASAPNGSWAGSFDADGALAGSGSGSLEHDMGATSFELLCDLGFELALVD
jgi:hypothetical protein